MQATLPIATPLPIAVEAQMSTVDLHTGVSPFARAGTTSSPAPPSPSPSPAEGSPLTKEGARFYTVSKFKMNTPIEG